jgi:type IV secretion system protein VirB2
MRKFLAKFLIFVVLMFSLGQNFYENNAYALTQKAPGLGEIDAITQVLCNVVELLTGKIAKGVSIIAIVVVAVGLFMGKFSWGVGLATAIGISMIFGASTVVNLLANGIGKAENAFNDFC